VDSSTSSSSGVVAGFPSVVRAWTYETVFSEMMLLSLAGCLGVDNDEDIVASFSS
jgi:hypothetical protein